jgi:2-iminobutanoate/2-iminopropanoate deaminase
MKRITDVEGLGRAAGPYSFAIITGKEVQTSGQIGQDADSRLVTEGYDIEGNPVKGIVAETHQVMRNLGMILTAAGVGYEDVTYTQIYLTDVDNDFGPVNDVYASYFPAEQFPARTTTEAAKLPLGAHVEIVMRATRPL